MTVVPVRNSVICRKIADEGTKETGGVVVSGKSVDLYEVISFSERDGFEFSVGDVVLPSGKGDEFEVSPGKSLFRFNVGNIMCRVLDPSTTRRA